MVIAGIPMEELRHTRAAQDCLGAGRQLNRRCGPLFGATTKKIQALRESVGLLGYGQKDPLIEYKNEGCDMFFEMMTQMRSNLIYSMFMFQPAAAAQQA